MAVSSPTLTPIQRLQQNIITTRGGITETKQDIGEVIARSNASVSEVLRGGGIRGVQQRAGQAEQRRAAESAGKELDAFSIQFETQLAQQSPEFANTQFKEAEYQKAKTAIESNIQRLDSQIQSLAKEQQRVREERGVSSSPEIRSIGYRIEALQAERNGWLGGIEGRSKEDVITRFSSGYTKDYAAAARSQNIAQTSRPSIPKIDKIDYNKVYQDSLASYGKIAIGGSINNRTVSEVAQAYTEGVAKAQGVSLSFKGGDIMVPTYEAGRVISITPKGELFIGKTTPEGSREIADRLLSGQRARVEAARARDTTKVEIIPIDQNKTSINSKASIGMPSQPEFVIGDTTWIGGKISKKEKDTAIKVDAQTNKWLDQASGGITGGGWAAPGGSKKVTDTTKSTFIFSAPIPMFAEREPRTTTLKVEQISPGTKVEVFENKDFFRTKGITITKDIPQNKAGQVEFSPYEKEKIEEIRTKFGTGDKMIAEQKFFGGLKTVLSEPIEDMKEYSLSKQDVILLDIQRKTLNDQLNYKNELEEIQKKYQKTYEEENQKLQKQLDRGEITYPIAERLSKQRYDDIIKSFDKEQGIIQDKYSKIIDTKAANIISASTPKITKVLQGTFNFIGAGEKFLKEKVTSKLWDYPKFLGSEQSTEERLMKLTKDLRASGLPEKDIQRQLMFANIGAFIVNVPRGAYEGIKEKPVKALAIGAVTLGTSTIGSAFGALSKSTSKVPAAIGTFGIMGLKSIQYVGLPIYGASIVQRTFLVPQNSAQAGAALGEIFSTEIAPGIAGAKIGKFAGQKLFQKSLTPQLEPAKQVKVEPLETNAKVRDKNYKLFQDMKAIAEGQKVTDTRFYKTTTIDSKGNRRLYLVMESSKIGKLINIGGKEIPISDVPLTGGRKWIGVEINVKGKPIYTDRISTVVGSSVESQSGEISKAISRSFIKVTEFSKPNWLTGKQKQTTVDKQLDLLEEIKSKSEPKYTIDTSGKKMKVSLTQVDEWGGTKTMEVRLSTKSKKYISVGKTYEISPDMLDIKLTGKNKLLIDLKGPPKITPKFTPPKITPKQPPTITSKYSDIILKQIGPSKIKSKLPPKITPKQTQTVVIDSYGKKSFYKTYPGDTVFEGLKEGSKEVATALGKRTVRLTNVKGTEIPETKKITEQGIKIDKYLTKYNTELRGLEKGEIRTFSLTDNIGNKLSKMSFEDLFSLAEKIKQGETVYDVLAVSKSPPPITPKPTPPKITPKIITSDISTKPAPPKITPKINIESTAANEQGKSIFGPRYSKMIQEIDYSSNFPITSPSPIGSISRSLSYAGGNIIYPIIPSVGASAVSLLSAVSVPKTIQFKSSLETGGALKQIQIQEPIQPLPPKIATKDPGTIFGSGSGLEYKPAEPIKDDTKIDQSLKSIQTPVNRQRIKQVVDTVLVRDQQFTQQMLGLRMGINKPIEPSIKIPIFKFRISDDKRRSIIKKKKKPTGYEVFIKKKKKYIRVSPSKVSLVKEEAEALGMKAVLKGAQVTYKLVPSDKPTVTIGTKIKPSTRALFRPGRKAGEFVQKERFRILTPGEKREVSKAGIQARKVKNSLTSSIKKSKSRRTKV